MSVERLLDGISFRLIGPATPFPGKKLGGFHFPRLRRRLEWMNTRLAHDPRSIRSMLWDASQAVPHMASFAVHAIINEAVACMPADQAYVNVGVWQGGSLLAGAIGNPDKCCVGVDNFSEYSGPREKCLRHLERYGAGLHIRFHDCTYAEYFARLHEGPIGFYYYDGEHSYEHQLEGLRAAEPFFAEGCLVLVDDTNREPPRRATEDFMKGSRFTYDTLLDMRTWGECHPTYWNGLMLFRRR